MKRSEILPPAVTRNNSSAEGVDLSFPTQDHRWQIQTSTISVTLANAPVHVSLLMAVDPVNQVIGSIEIVSGVPTEEHYSNLIKKADSGRSPTSSASGLPKPLPRGRPSRLTGLDQGQPSTRLNQVKLNGPMGKALAERIFARVRDELEKKNG